MINAIRPPGDRLTLRKLAVLILLAVMLGLAPAQSNAVMFAARAPIVYVLPRRTARRYRRTALRRLGLAC